MAYSESPGFGLYKDIWFSVSILVFILLFNQYYMKVWCLAVEPSKCINDLSSASNLNKLQLLQNGACRTLLLVDKRTPIDEMHKELKFLTLGERQNLHLAVDCYKHVKNEESSLHNYFKVKRSRQTRAGEQMVVPNLWTNMGRNAYSFTGPNFWNQVPSDLKSCKNVDEFKSEYLNYILRDVNHPT